MAISLILASRVAAAVGRRFSINDLEVIMRYLWLGVIVFVLAESAEAQGSRKATAASYVDRGNSWIAKGELDRAIADFDQPFSLTQASPALITIAGGAAPEGKMGCSAGGL